MLDYSARAVSLFPWLCGHTQTVPAIFVSCRHCESLRVPSMIRKNCRTARPPAPTPSEAICDINVDVNS